MMNLGEVGKEGQISVFLWEGSHGLIRLYLLTDKVSEKIPRIHRLYSFLCCHHGPTNCRSDHQENPEEFHLPAGALQVPPCLT